MGVGEEQGSLAYCSPWGRKESDRTDQLNNIYLGFPKLLLSLQFLKIISLKESMLKRQEVKWSTLHPGKI